MFFPGQNNSLGFRIGYRYRGGFDAAALPAYANKRNRLGGCHLHLLPGDLLFMAFCKTTGHLSVSIDSC